MSENFGGPCCGSGTDKDEHIAQRRLRNHTHLVVYETTGNVAARFLTPLKEWKWGKTNGNTVMHFLKININTEHIRFFGGSIERQAK